MAGAGGGGGGGGEKEEEENRRRDEEVERALHLDGAIPGSSNEFVKQVSSRAYDMRRHLQQTFDSSSYDGKILPLRFLNPVKSVFPFSCFKIINYYYFLAKCS